MLVASTTMGLPKSRGEDGNGVHGPESSDEGVLDRVRMDEPSSISGVGAFHGGTEPWSKLTTMGEGAWKEAIVVVYALEYVTFGFEFEEDWMGGMSGSCAWVLWSWSKSRLAVTHLA